MALTTPIENAFAKLVAQAPSAVITVAILYFIIFVVKEYRSLKRENSELTKQFVYSIIGEIRSSMEAQIAEISLSSGVQQKRLDEIDSLYSRFTNDLKSKESSLEQIYETTTKQLNAIQSDLGVMMNVVKDIDQYSVADLVGQVEESEDSRMAVFYCNRILEDPDASGKDLERAGDSMRRRMRYPLAIRLYERSVEIDPQRLSARIELLALQAELRPGERDVLLREAMQLVIDQPDRVVFARVANALIELSKYELLNEFCTRCLELLSIGNPGTKALVLRNKGIALREVGLISEALEALREAFAIRPTEENVFQPYLNILEENIMHDEYSQVASKLLSIDPLRTRHYLLYAKALILQKAFAEAQRYLELACSLPMDKKEEAIVSVYSNFIATSIAQTASENA
ncbi:tetratricopeptide repeat protein [Cyanobium sp. FGCU-6]|nr:tetratricopeptide repeat protein [Cyanobium sp. FGCU6]